MSTMGVDTPSPALQEEPLQPVRGCEAPASLRPILLTLLQTGGVPPQMAEGIADILEEAGYQEFRPMDEFTMRRRKARALTSATPDSLCETLCDKSTQLADDPAIMATHHRINFERLAALNHRQNKSVPFLLTQGMRA